MTADIEHPSWRDAALCREVDSDLFFPEKGQSTRPAKNVCRRCDVRAQCLAWAVEHDERFGVWGGLSTRERARLARARCPAEPAVA